MVQHSPTKLIVPRHRTTPGSRRPGRDPRRLGQRPRSYEIRLAGRRRRNGVELRAQRNTGGILTSGNDAITRAGGAATNPGQSLRHAGLIAASTTHDPGVRRRGVHRTAAWQATGLCAASTTLATHHDRRCQPARWPAPERRGAEARRRRGLRPTHVRARKLRRHRSTRREERPRPAADRQSTPPPDSSERPQLRRPRRRSRPRPPSTPTGVEDRSHGQLGGRQARHPRSADEPSRRRGIDALPRQVADPRSRTHRSARDRRRSRGRSRAAARVEIEEAGMERRPRGCAHRSAERPAHDRPDATTTRWDQPSKCGSQSHATPPTTETCEGVPSSRAQCCLAVRTDDDNSSHRPAPRAHGRKTRPLSGSQRAVTATAPRRAPPEDRARAKLDMRLHRSSPQGPETRAAARERSST